MTKVVSEVGLFYSDYTAGEIIKFPKKACARQTVIFECRFIKSFYFLFRTLIVHVFDLCVLYSVFGEKLHHRQAHLFVHGKLQHWQTPCLFI